MKFSKIKMLYHIKPQAKFLFKILLGRQHFLFQISVRKEGIGIYISSYVVYYLTILTLGYFLYLVKLLKN